MSLVDIINADIKTAMLAKEKEKLEAIRAVKSALLLAQTSGDAVTEDSEIKLLQKLVKQRREAAEIYTTQNRPDLAQVENFQADIINKYLPAQMSEDELRAIVKRIVGETGATSVKDMGKVMGAATKELAGKADNKTISIIIKEFLGA
ncbi:MAG: GatB/YqeY domain-containing protein [Bacteroidetes bacterium]|nr:GatB/YqeY domain-containing protein [Bacteroidota bacterium]